MVYSELYFIRGIILTVAQLKEICENFLGEDVSKLDYYEIRGALNEVLDDNQLRYQHGCTLELFQFFHQKDINSPDCLFILGVKLHTYYHRTVRCENCKKYSLCDKCIGYTNNGYYDVDAISKGPVSTSNRDVCLMCYHDNRHDMGAPIRTCIDEPMTDEEKSDFERRRQTCKLCERMCWNDDRTPKDYLKWHTFQGDVLMNKVMKEFEIKQPLGFYYATSDCLCCT